MALSDGVRRARWALELARHEEAERITEEIQLGRVVGVLGEAEVGKTETTRLAIGNSTPDHPVVRLDLDGVASEEHLAFHIARKVSSAYLGEAAFSTLKVGVLVPNSIEAGRVELAELLGVDGLDEALLDWPSGRYQLSPALAALGKLAERRDTILWIDHLEAPSLTPRHPLDLDRVLWAVREMIQSQRSLRLVLSGREAGEGSVLGREAAFHQQGRWLSLDNPPPEAWKTVARSLRVSEATAAELAEKTGGHPETMLIALLMVEESGARPPADELLRDLGSTSGALAGRAMQHARSLHRLGGQVLHQVALGLGPYAASQRGTSPPQEIRKVLGRLQLAGLIRHDEGWSIVNPLVRIALRGELAWTPASDWKLEGGPEDDELGDFDL